MAPSAGALLHIAERLAAPDILGMRRMMPGIALVVALASLTGCATGPPRPAMVSLAQTGSYGFSEDKLAADRYKVRYVSPRLRVSAMDPQHSDEVKAQRQRTFDLALWRAADLTLQNGYPAFIVERDNRDATVTVRNDPLYAPFGPYPFYDGFDRFGHYRPGFYPYYPYPYYPYESGYRTRVVAQVQTVLEIRMLEKPTEKSYDAAATAARLKKTYGSATYPPD